jgi:hypothetical protein
VGRDLVQRRDPHAWLQNGEHRILGPAPYAEAGFALPPWLLQPAAR